MLYWLTEGEPVPLENREPKLAEGCFTLEGLVVYTGPRLEEQNGLQWW